MTRSDIENDPYAHKEAETLRKQLRLLTRALRKLKQTEREKLTQHLEPLLAVAAEQHAKRYFDHLSELQGAPHHVEIDCGEHPVKFIAAQARYPKLRRLYVMRRIAQVLHHSFHFGLRGGRSDE